MTHRFLRIKMKAPVIAAATITTTRMQGTTIAAIGILWPDLVAPGRFAFDTGSKGGITVVLAGVGALVDECGSVFFEVTAAIETVGEFVTPVAVSAGEAGNVGNEVGDKVGGNGSGTVGVMLCTVGVMLCPVGVMLCTGWM